MNAAVQVKRRMEGSGDAGFLTALEHYICGARMEAVAEEWAAEVAEKATADVAAGQHVRDMFARKKEKEAAEEKKKKKKKRNKKEGRGK